MDTLMQGADTLLQQAQDLATTPFDYVIVGSGAGGGPLAARLALQGRRVLLVEAGRDAALDAHGRLREVYQVPAYNAAASEDPEMRWDFSVRHYTDAAQQAQDRKYRAEHDPSAHGAPGRGGILYPRCSALGGCTAHHAMVMIRPNDDDWDRIAARTGDPTWGSGTMQGYFPRIERNLYYRVYDRFLGRILGGILGLARKVATVFDPQGQLDAGGHGRHGWQPTSFIDPIVVGRIAWRDRIFRGVLLNAAAAVLSRKAGRNALLRAFLKLRIVQALDPNVRSPRFPERPRLCLIPTGIDGSERSGVREHLLHVQRHHPDRLVIATETFATRVVFSAGRDAPCAVGIRVRLGSRLYAASADPRGDAGQAEERTYFARGEVILCGGTFNTPQLLMLSGIGPAAHLQANGITHLQGADGSAVAPLVDLPGVGANLQDRYEVSVVAEACAEFSALKGASFQPGDANDPAIADWREGLPGLYSMNGGALAAMERSRLVDPRKPPNLFIIGVPAAFRGYYWGWSKDLLCRDIAHPEAPPSRKLWSWVILQAYTSNNRGTVRLLSNDPFATPEVLFNSFDPGDPKSRDDLSALHDAIERVREINAGVKQIVAEIEPGPGFQSREDTERWIRKEAWGHHACGTCRIGSDPWRADAAHVQDAGAVLDSSFRVHGVTGLRVVDASVFPEIPGYFIVTPTFMVAEKAADALLADAAEYPAAFERREAHAIHARRVACGAPPGPETDALPPDTIGLALSGGGIRSATYGLGVLQALAQAGTLSRIDIMSCVSGGGYVGSFLGRLFTRHADAGPQAFQRVREALGSPATPELWWLRQYANYLGGSGRTDLLSTLGHVARNLFSVHFFLGVLALGLFAALRLAADRWLSPQTPQVAGFAISPWWWVPPALLFLLTVPYVLAYWLSPPPRARESFAALPILVWLALAGVAIAAIGIEPIAAWGALMTAGVVLAWALQELARWRVQRGAAGDMGQAGPSVRVRNRLNRGVGISIELTLAATLFVVLDSAARVIAALALDIASWAMALAVIGLAFLRTAAIAIGEFSAPQPNASLGRRTVSAAVAALAFGMLAVVLLFLDIVAHAAFVPEPRVGVWLLLSCVAVSLLLGRGLPFLNLSSLHAFYTEKLVRTFLGASNDARVRPKGADAPVRIDVPDARDDIWLHRYHPERAGCPLHLINTCVNSTVDAVSGRQLPQDRGLPMCLGPVGISVGRRFHATWGAPSARGEWPRVEPLPASTDPNAFHVLARSDDHPVRVEPLRLGQWTAISGAAFSTGAGRETRLTRSLLFGLLNVRLGYWWNSGIPFAKRPSRYPLGFWRFLKGLPAFLFRAQAVLLSEWRGSFPGPSARHWYLSDGGHFDNSGLYELLRRRVPFIVAVVAGDRGQAGPAGELAVVTRAARVDFGAEFAWGPPAQPVPGWITALLQAQGIGTLADLDNPRSRRCAALCHVTYRTPGARNESWLLLLKPKLMRGLPVDLATYAAGHPDFPYQSVVDQFFDDAQWESYRMLGLLQGTAVFK